jgi:hypothetical protein
MRQKRTSTVSPFSNQALLQEAVTNSECVIDVIRTFFPTYNGKGTGHYNTVKKYLSLYGIDTSHFEVKRRMTSGILLMSRSSKLDIWDILAGKHPHYGSDKLRPRLIKEGILQNQCRECGLGDEWNGKPITLQLDHIDGNRLNNRLENLRIICPNCHTQTATHSSRNKNGTGGRDRTAARRDTTSLSTTDTPA